MTEFYLEKWKDLGLQREVMHSLPYAVVGNAWKGTFIDSHDGEIPLINHIVPAGAQLKVLFLRVWTQHADGAKFVIRQTNPTVEETTGAVEAFPVVGSVPSGVRDYPMLEAAGAEVLHGGLETPIHVLEGSIDFKIQHTPSPATGDYFGIAWWGVQKHME